jgi:hypothetical protein
LKLLLFFIFEIGLFSYFAETYGFLDTFFWYWIPTLLALSVMPFLFQRFQRSMQVTGPQMLHHVLVNLGLLSLALPFVSLRALGLILVLPGLRHLLIWKLSGFIQTKMTKYQTAPGHGNFFYFRTHSTAPWPPTEQPPMKDVTPIDVTKIETHSNKND